jgi:hypothetical protein
MAFLLEISRFFGFEASAAPGRSGRMMKAQPPCPAVRRKLLITVAISFDTIAVIKHNQTS